MHTTSIRLTALLLLIILQPHVKISNGFSDLSLKSGDLDAMVKSCDGKVGTCSEMEEFELVSRRVLSEQRRYISYETLKRDVVPCSTPGSSYYRCGLSPANHYTRGCSVITQCARF